MRWCLLLLVACRPILVPPPALVEIFVDGSATEEGDGSLQSPFKHLAPALKAGARVHLATGLYPFSGELPDLELIGDKQAVLYAEGDAPFVLSIDRARLEHLTVQGGQWGIVSTGDVSLDKVSFSGQRAGAAHLVTGTLKIDHSTIEGTLPDTVGVRAEPGTHLSVGHSGFRGELTRALDLVEAEADVNEVGSSGPRVFVHAVGGRTQAKKCHAELGAGAAFSVARGDLNVFDCTVFGHEYGVLAGEGSQLTVNGFRSEGVQISAIAVVKSTASIKHLDALRPGGHGAVELLESTTALESLRTIDGTDLGIFVRHGKLTATGIDIRRLGGEGDAIHIRDAEATLDGVNLVDISGAGVVSTAVATVTVRNLQCIACAHGTLLVDRLSSLTGVNIKTSTSPAATVGEDGKLTLENLDYTGDAPAVWAECTGASKVVLRGRRPARELLTGACIETP